MKNPKNLPAANREWKAVALLAGVMVVLFWRSFCPGYVHFSNDGPLGQQKAAWSQLPAAFFGTWGDLPDVGGGGSLAPSLSGLFRWAVGPVGYAKFVAPLALFILGLGAWTFFRQLKLSRLAAVLGAMAAMLNSTFLATACWGVATQQIAIGMDFFALALIVSNTAETPARIRWLRVVLAGMCVGLNIMDAADIGAIFSMFLAAYILVRTLTVEAGTLPAKTLRGIVQVIVVAVFAGFVSAQTVISLVGTQIKGIAGMEQNTETAEQHWDWATQWSLPKTETMGLFVPGIFGYRMDTPNGMPSFLQDAYSGGVYWGGMGRTPDIDRFFDSKQPGAPPPGMMRFTGGQNYAGITVLWIALWAIAQAFRRKDSVFSDLQRKQVLFWTVVALGTVFLAWGRFTPFDLYRHTIYNLPYFSTIRNPVKFILVFSWAVPVLFAYGVHGFSQRYLAANNGLSSISAQLKNWWERRCLFDRKWTGLTLACVAVAVIGEIVYAVNKPALIHYLQKVGYPDDGLSRKIADFSVMQGVWFIFYFVAVALLCVLVMSGVFAGRRAKAAGFLLGSLLLFDLGRADLPFIIHWNYPLKYASNPIVDMLRDRPYEHRVAVLHSDSLFENVYDIEWVQQLFPYYNIQSLDVVQRPRVASMDAAYQGAFTARTQEDSYLVGRHWQLSNTRYLVGPAGYLDSLNEQLDPDQKRFRIAARFEIISKPEVARAEQLQDLTAVSSESGQYALFDFTAALPRASVFSNWQVDTNDQDVLKTLADRHFDPLKMVLVSMPVPASPTTGGPNAVPAEYKSYSPQTIVLAANAPVPSILLLNDRYDPSWTIKVDGKPAELLRCNFIMRGVFLAPGNHTVEFHFSLPNGPFYVTVTALVMAVALCGVLFVWTRRKPGQP